MDNNDDDGNDDHQFENIDNDCPYNHKKLSIWLKNRHVGWVEYPEIFLTKHSKVYLSLAHDPAMSSSYLFISLLI